MKETVNFHGKEYETVASRVHRFRESYPVGTGWGIVTEIVHVNSESVIVRASVTNEGGAIMGVGHAEEKRANSGVNKDHALENAETSAIGRALAACDYHGTEYASADEMSSITPESLKIHISNLELCESMQQLSETWTEIYGAVPGAEDRKMLAAVKDEMKRKLA
jgi:hypothetical protein